MINEKQSPEYAKRGPVNAKDVKPKPVDADMERMKAAHAARMAGEPAVVPDPDARVLLPSPAAIFDLAQSGRTSASAPNLSAGSPTIQHAAYAALVDELKMTSDNVRGLIVQETDALQAMLLDKNTRYGNSALEPLGIFSKLSATQGILVRLDDKLKRIKNMGHEETLDEDTLADLIGYLVLLRVAKRLKLDA